MTTSTLTINALSAEDHAAYEVSFTGAHWLIGYIYENGDQGYRASWFPLGDAEAFLQQPIEEVEDPDMDCIFGGPDIVFPTPEKAAAAIAAAYINQPVNKAMVKLAPDHICGQNLVAQLNRKAPYSPSKREFKQWITYASNEQGISMTALLRWMNQDSPVKRSTTVGDLVGFAHEECEDWFLITNQGYQWLALK